ncbi:MAG: FecR family protein [Planctomycetales bacterium]
MVTRYCRRFSPIFAALLVLDGGARADADVIFVDHRGDVRVFGDASGGGPGARVDARQDFSGSGSFDLSLDRSFDDQFGSGGSLSARVNLQQTASALRLIASANSLTNTGTSPLGGSLSAFGSSNSELVVTVSLTAAMDFRHSGSIAGVRGTAGNSAFVSLSPFSGPGIFSNQVSPDGTVPISHSGNLPAGDYLYTAFFGANSEAVVDPFTGENVPTDAASIALDLLLEFTQPEPQVVVTDVAGSVQVRKASGEVIPAIRGTGLSQGDTVITGADGFAELTFRDGVVVTIGPDAEFVLAADTEEGSVVDLLNGLIDFLSDPFRDRRWEGRTPNAVTSPRGTEFSISYFELSGFGTTTIDVLSGLVDVTNRQTGQFITTVGAGDTFSLTTPLDPGTQPVPEPASLAIWGLAGLGLFAWRGRLRRSSSSSRRRRYRRG